VIVGIMVVLGGGLVIGAKKITGKRGESVDKRRERKRRSRSATSSSSAPTA